LPVYADAASRVSTANQTPLLGVGTGFFQRPVEASRPEGNGY